MKKLRSTVILLLIVNLTTSGQTGAWQVFNVNKLAQKNTLLRGWQMQAGDNSKRVLPAYNDNRWKPFDPSQDVKDLESGKSYWLGLRFRVDSALKISDFGFSITQNVASVVYLDGKQLVSYGNLRNAVAYNPGNQPVHVNLSPGEHIVLVYIVTPNGLLKFRTQDEVFDIFQLKINRYYKSVANYDQYESDNMPQIWIFLVITGIFFILFVTHTFFFAFYRKQKAHLYYAIVTFFLLLEMVGNIILADPHWPKIDRWVWFFELVNYSCLIFFILILYTLFNYPGRGVIKFFAGLIIPFAIALWFNGMYAYYLFSALVPLMIALECVRIGIWAKRNKKSPALIVVTACCIFLVFVVIQILLTGALSTLLFLIAMVSFPVGMSVFLAIQTAAVNRSLEKKLAEVEYLSEKNQQYQLEKQQILTDQNSLLERQVDERTTELNRSLIELRQTQAQLIQSEKMASLGELTAGIAHEIQNPLNFVNNFSEVNKDLLEELKAESKKQKAERDDELEAELIDDLIDNSEKINQHGKRADFIVKGMLEHSRKSSGEKQPTNMNVLCEEFLKLSYHGLRARDKSFNADMITHFDPALLAINVSQQDIGRVMLNLFNNAFYAVNKKAKTAGPDYRPMVEVSTSVVDDQVVISVRDNGSGIPDAIRDKIMQPFFTTKPTGEGTGLGLSLSYDIVVKGHGGNIIVDSKEGEFSLFTISLPIF